jgi:hypothetical protein
MADRRPGDQGVGHEVRDVRVRGVLIAGIGVLGLMLVASGVTRVLVGHYVRREARSSAPANPLAERWAPALPPEPRLQTDPMRDLLELRAREGAQLHGYAWADRQTGHVRIPIERAMALLATDGASTP